MLRSVLLVLASLCFIACDGARPAPPVPPPPHASAPVIWRLVSRQHVIAAHAGIDGPTYTVTNLTGELLMAEATLDEIAVQDPALHRFLSTLQANGLWANAYSEPMPSLQP